MATLKDFVPESVSLTWGGINLEGFAPDTFITAARQSANTMNSVGAAGDVGITKIADKTGTVEITLMQTAATHRYLSYIQYQQDSENNDIIRANMTITDPSGGFLMRAENVHIMQPPEISLGSDQSPKTWTFFAERLSFIEAPSNFVQPAGEASRIVDAYGVLKGFSDKLNDQTV